MSRVRLLVATVTALFTCLSSTLACSCVGGTTKDIYCRSDYAIAAKILSKTPISTNPWVNVYEYKFEVLENYKPSPELDAARQVIQATDADMLCGVLLSTGSNYLLMGYFSEDWKSDQSNQLVLATSSCNLNRELSSSAAVARTEAGHVMSFLNDGNFRCETRGSGNPSWRSLVERIVSRDLNADTEMK
ncbi:uncharacterized protein LOC127836530 [Dreissena polymorpha]|uniref:NTR domain-containing protein n=1 Tax=Dreissena polymorpha TaxID=45954 RepID=A0A9D4FX10_DREPO|nr:uncharacterized protein LOC127836530 [Dreissena polymorpha]KAH3805154.1 hypothetical protein DPMN_133450 [Dreissena polymorpha]